MKKDEKTEGFVYSRRNSRFTPLMQKMRPKRLEELVGQEKILGKNGIIAAMLSSGRLSSLIFWGRPGTGKTTLGLLLAQHFLLRLEYLSAVFASVKDLRQIFERARRFQEEEDKGTCLFVDEIHRFNRAQQDGFLPYIEDGTIILIGATTENPSFALRGALLSRARVVVLEALKKPALGDILKRTEKALNKNLLLTAEAEDFLLEQADGDARRLIVSVELLSLLNRESEKKPLTKENLKIFIEKQGLFYDSSGDEHFNLISAVHKTLRGSDADAALYYILRMLLSGEDPQYLARRMLRFAYEDVGLADPEAAKITLTAWQTYERLGSPEGEIALITAAIYLAYAPKSNSSYKAMKAAREAAEKFGSLPPPKTILNAATSLMKNLEYGKGYVYDHDTEDGFSGQDYFPDAMKRQEFYKPIERGFEREMKKRKKYFDKRRSNQSVKDS